MKTISIKSLNIENFKKVKQANYDFENLSASILGKNESGKTTLNDAFTWLLFGKDSLGADEKSFSIRPLNKNGDLIHFVDIVVEAVLTINGKDLKLKKVRKEKWVKSRETREQEFSGNENDYYINAVPTKANEYKNKISEIIDEDLFKLLTDAKYFSNIDWKKRREVIFKLVGNITDEVVIGSDSTLKPLLQHLEDGKSIDDLLKITKDKKNKLNKDLEMLPAKISERMLDTFSDLKNVDSASLNATLVSLQEKHKNAVESKLSPLKSNMKLELREELYKLEDDYKLETKASKEALQQALDNKQKSINALSQIASQKGVDANVKENKIKGLTADIKAHESRIEKYTLEFEELKKEYAEIKASQPTTADTCYNCNQALPKDMIDTQIEKFNQDKAKKLESNIARGKELKFDLASEVSEKELATTTIETLTEEVEVISQEIKEIEIEANALDLQAFAEVETPRALEIKKALTLKNQELQDLNNAKEETLDDPNAGLVESINKEIEEVTTLLARTKERATNQARILELQQEEKRIQQEYETVYSLQILCESFIVKKAEMIEKSVNDNFNIVKFKLFETQINGGIAETCMPTLNGVPYPSINSAGKVEVGLDIISALQKAYGVKAPIWIDNAESITNIPAMDCQVIKLYVSPKTANLEVVLVEEEKEVIVKEVVEAKEESKTQVQEELKLF